VAGPLLNARRRCAIDVAGAGSVLDPKRFCGCSDTLDPC
jgi:hypothetical protein